MLTFSDIPDDFRRDRPDGENIGRLASGVQAELEAIHGAAGLETGLRLVQASFRFRSGEIGREMTMARSAQEVHETLTELPQLVEFAGCLLAAVSLASTIDLAAAAVYRLHFGAPSPSDPSREVDLDWFFDAKRKSSRKALNDLPRPFRKWLKETHEHEQWKILKGVRDHFVHRHFPINITITIGGAELATQELVVEGRIHPVSQFLNDCRAFVVDRFITVGLLMRPASNGGS